MSVLRTSGGGPSGALSGWALKLVQRARKSALPAPLPCPLGPPVPPSGAAVVPTPAR